MTAIAAIRLNYLDRSDDLAELLGTADDLEAVALVLSNVAAALLLPAAQGAKATAPDLLDRLMDWVISDEGGKPGDAIEA